MTGETGSKSSRAIRDPFAWCLAAVVFFRPWRDGMTYPVFNFYFCWVLFALAIGWGVRRFYSRAHLRFAVPTVLLAGYVLIAFVGAAGTFQVDATYRALIYWAGHFLLFFLCLQAIRGRAGVGLVLGAFVASSYANAVWSIIHLYYVLPTMREQLLTNPEAAYYYFRMREVPEALQHRLDMNRAFGTLLQPNALAAFMVLGIPYLLGESANTIRYWLGARGDSPRASFRAGLAGGAGAGLTLLALARPIYPYLLGIVAHDPNWRSHILLNWIFFVLLPFGAGITTFYTSRRFGFRALRMAVQSALLPCAFAVELMVLFLTFSRGGLIALVAGLALGGALFLGGTPRLRVKYAVLAGVFTAVVALAAWGRVSWAQAPGDLSAPTVEERVQGLDVETTDLLSTSTFRLRLTYWAVGLRMARDNPWGGVGLGNFGTAYANYQYHGAGDVQTAHNVLVQTLSETGLFGLLAFCAFWLYVFVWGARRVVRERDWGRRAALCGMYAGVAAFCIHSLVDFDFVNPALAGMVFAMSALFLRRADSGEETAAVRTWRGAAIPLAVVFAAAIGFGASLRPYIVEFGMTTGDWKEKAIQVGDRKRLRDRVEVARYFFQELPQHPTDGAPLPYRWYQDLALIVPERELLESFGRIYVYDPKNPEASLPLPPDETPGRLAILQIHDVERAQQVAVSKSLYWLSAFGRLDRIYPHIPELSQKIAEWYRLLEAGVSDQSEKQSYAESALDWARKGVERNPRQAWMHSAYAQALWFRAAYTPWPQNIDFYERGLAEYRLSRNLYSISPTVWRQYATAAEKFGGALVSTGTDRARGERLIAEAKQAAAHAAELGRPPGGD